MKALIFEQWSGGHYDVYLRALVPRAASLVERLVVATVPRSAQTAEVTEAAWRALPNLERLELPAIAANFSPRSRRDATYSLRRTVEAVGADVVLVPSADAYLPSLVWSGRSSLRRVEPTFHYGYGNAATGAKDRLKEWVYSSFYSRLRTSRVNFVSYAYYEHALRRRIVDPQRARLVGDPIPEPETVGKARARRELGLEENGRYVGLVGSLDDRKAVPLILQAYRRAGFGQDVKLLLAGRLSPTYRALVASEYADLVANGSIVLIDRMLSEAELCRGLEALDLMMLVYWKFPGLSSLALRAISYGTPILSHRFGWLQTTIDRFSAGITTNAFDTDRFAHDLRSWLHMPFRPLVHEPARRLLAFHSEQGFADRMLETLDPLRAAAAPTWPWVLESLA